MNVRRFTGRTSREALAKVRAALGDEAIVLKNRAIVGGVEVLAMADDGGAHAASDDSPLSGEQGIERTLADSPKIRPARSEPIEKPRAAPRLSLAQRAQAQMARAQEAQVQPLSTQQLVPVPPPAASRQLPVSKASALARPVSDEPMSTLTFQQFVRDRLARSRRVEGEADEVDTRPVVSTDTTAAAQAALQRQPDLPRQPVALPPPAPRLQPPDGEVLRGARGISGAQSALRAHAIDDELELPPPSPSQHLSIGEAQLSQPFIATAPGAARRRVAMPSTAELRAQLQAISERRLPASAQSALPKPAAPAAAIAPSTQPAVQSAAQPAAAPLRRLVPDLAQQASSLPEADDHRGLRPIAAPLDDMPLTLTAPVAANLSGANQPSLTATVTSVAPPSLGEMLGSAGPALAERAGGSSNPAVMAELREMRGLITSQLSSMAWMDGVRRSPLQVTLLRHLISAGLSAQLSRKLVSRMPADCSEREAHEWIAATLKRLLRCDVGGSGLLDRGGIFALVGPTGVGKTTSAAKIAAQFALRHGVQSVGLVTVDAYRIGAQDQLRTFGRLLGVPVHVAHDAGTLAEFLHLFMNKKLVLVDTVGVGQRDERVAELLASLGTTSIRKLLVLNAASQAETIEDVIVAYQAQSAAGVVLSKVDEAVKTGGLLDCVIRHRLQVVGVANGQRVPEDWHLPDSAALIEQALAARGLSAFDFDDNELAMLLADGCAAASSDSLANPPRAGAALHV